MTQPTRQILEQIAALTSDGVIVLDAAAADFPVVYVNPAYEELTGYSAEETVGRPWSVLGTDSGDCPQTAALRAALGGGESYAAMLVAIRKDGTSWQSRTRVQPILTRRGELKAFLVMQTEAVESSPGQTGIRMGLLQRELVRARKQVASLDRIDSASGILRYEYFCELADRDCRKARRHGESVGAAVIEINDLDAYRDTFGAKAADSCLRMIAAQVTGSLRRAGDICGCEDGRRIVALMQGLDADDVAALTDRIAANVRRLGLHNPRGRSGRYVTVSVGVAAGKPTSGDFLKRLIGEARERVGAGPGASSARRSAQA